MMRVRLLPNKTQTAEENMIHILKIEGFFFPNLQQFSHFHDILEGFVRMEEVFLNYQ